VSAGAAVMRMTQHFVGSDNFRKGLQAFVKKL
jgi:aminopeptidase N